MLGKGQGRLRCNNNNVIELVFTGEIFSAPQLPNEMEVVPRNLFIRICGIDYRVSSKFAISKIPPGFLT